MKPGTTVARNLPDSEPKKSWPARPGSAGDSAVVVPRATIDCALGGQRGKLRGWQQQHHHRRSHLSVHHINPCHAHRHHCPPPDRSHPPSTTPIHCTVPSTCSAVDCMRFTCGEVNNEQRRTQRLQYLGVESGAS